MTYLKCFADQTHPQPGAGAVGPGPVSAGPGAAAPLDLTQCNQLTLQQGQGAPGPNQDLCKSVEEILF